MLAIASQSDEALQEAAVKWKLTNTIMKGDPSNSFMKYLEGRYAASSSLKFIVAEKKGYPNGMVQPAELVMVNKGKQLIVAWVRKPSMMNFDGAMGRPDATKMWKYIDEKAVLAEDGGDNSTGKDIQCSDGRQFFSIRSSII